MEKVDRIAVNNTPGKNLQKNKIIVTDRKPTVTVKTSDQGNKKVKFDSSKTIGNNLEKEMAEIVQKKIVQTRLENFKFKKVTKEIDQNCAQETEVMRIVKVIEKKEKNMTGNAKKVQKIVTGRIEKKEKFSSPTLKKKTQKTQNKTLGNQKNQNSRLELFSPWTRNQNIPMGASRTPETLSLLKFKLQEEDIKALHGSKQNKVNSNLPPPTEAKEGAPICD